MSGTPALLTDEAVKVAPGMLQISVVHFRSPHRSIRYVFKDGKIAEFVNHFFTTNKKYQIEELREEQEHLKLIEHEEVIDYAELTDPLLALKNKYRREFLAEQALDRIRTSNLDTPMGDYEQGKNLNAQSTRGAVDPDAIMSAQVSAEFSGAATFPRSSAVPAAVDPKNMAALMAKLHGNTQPPQGSVEPNRK